MPGPSGYYRPEREAEARRIMKEEGKMKGLSERIDIGSDSHHMIILGEKEHILYQQKVSHQLKEMKETIKQLKYLEKKEKAKLTFALEKKTVTVTTETVSS